MSFSPSPLRRLSLDMHSLLLKAEARSHPLRQLFWECTLRCNLRCRHCGSDCTASTVVPDMPFQDFEKVLLQVKETYDPSQVLVILSGGEPLMRGDLALCGARIRQLGFPWGMVTNGCLLTGERLKELVTAGLRTITVSLDGLEAEHDWMRGVPGTFARTDAAIRMLSQLPSLGFDVVTCVTEKNFSLLPAIKEYLVEAGVKSWRIFTVFPVGRAATDRELQLSPEQLRSLMEFIVECRKEKRIHASYGCEGFLGPWEGRVRDHLFSCQAGLSIASVRIDGTISGCTSIRSAYGQGNIYKDDFVQVWEQRFGLYRDRSPLRTGPCAGCKSWRWCRGSGMHLRDNEGRLLLCTLDRLTEPER